MTKSDVQYEHVFIKLKRVFGNDNVFAEWDTKKGASDEFGGEAYGPRVDFAIAPFNTESSRTQSAVFNDAYEKHKELISKLSVRGGYGSELSFNSNPNPRCFIAIEIEDYTSMKHMLGSILNVSILAKVGIVLGADAKAFGLLTRLKKYLEYVAEHGKGNNIRLENVIILQKDAFCDLM